VGLVDGLKPTDDFAKMANKEILGTLTLADIEKSFNVACHFDSPCKFSINIVIFSPASF